jgi:hypothetical protein
MEEGAVEVEVPQLLLVVAILSGVERVVAVEQERPVRLVVLVELLPMVAVVELGQLMERQFQVSIQLVLPLPLVGVEVEQK